MGHSVESQLRCSSSSVIDETWRMLFLGLAKTQLVMITQRARSMRHDVPYSGTVVTPITGSTKVQSFSLQNATFC